MTDFLGLRPVFHWTETRVQGHIAVCVYAAVIEAMIANQLTHAAIWDPNLEDQIITARRALGELDRIRIHHLTASDQQITITTRPNQLQTAILDALDIDTRTWHQHTTS